MSQLNKYLPLALIVVFPLGQLSSIPLLPTPIKIYYHDLIILLLLIFNVKTVITIFKTNTPLIGFTSLGLFSLLLNMQIGLLPIILSSLYLARLIAYLTIIHLLPELITLKQARPYILLTIITTILLGIAQYLLIPLLEPLFILGWDRHAYRLVGTHLDPNFTGLLYTLALIWIINHLLKHHKHPYIHWTTTLGLIVVIMLTYSRSTYLALVTSTTWILKHKVTPKIIATSVILFIIALLLLPQRFGEGTKLLRTSTINARISNWQDALQLIQQKPLFGHGFNTLKYIQPNAQHNTTRSNSQSGYDNGILTLLATVGIFGTMQFLWFIANLISSSPNKKLITASLIAIFTHTMFLNSLLYPWTLLWISFINIKDK